MTQPRVADRLVGGEAIAHTPAIATTISDITPPMRRGSSMYIPA